jgi:hypothetical protein
LEGEVEDVIEMQKKEEEKKTLTQASKQAMVVFAI